MSDINQSPKKNTYKGLGMAIGLVFGGFLGLLTGNLIQFAGGTMLLGFAIGTALDARNE